MCRLTKLKALKSRMIKFIRKLFGIQSPSRMWLKAQQEGIKKYHKTIENYERKAVKEELEEKYGKQMDIS